MGRRTGAGEGIRTLDPNLGNIYNTREGNFSRVIPSRIQSADLGQRPSGRLAWVSKWGFHGRAPQPDADVAVLVGAAVSPRLPEQTVASIRRCSWRTAALSRCW